MSKVYSEFYTCVNNPSQTYEIAVIREEGEYARVNIMDGEKLINDFGSGINEEQERAAEQAGNYPGDLYADSIEEAKQYIEDHVCRPPSLPED